MDVHPPHDPVHTWRDFAVHLTIVTIGLLIALSLEGFVEYMHHRHLVHEARENIRQEIELNHKAAQRHLELVQKNIQNEKAIIQTIRLLRTRPKNFHGSISNTMDFNSMNDAAWRTARDTGALSYMPYEEVQRYSNLYMLENLVNTHAINTGERDFLASTPFEMGDDVTMLADADYSKLLHDNAEIIINLGVLKQFVQQFDNQCVEELKK